jgi:hypothetical protein
LVNVPSGEGFVDGRYILGLLFMSVIFSNGFLGFVWWSPSISPAGYWIMIFVPFFNVFASVVGIMVVWSYLDRYIDVSDRRRKYFVSGIYPPAGIPLVRFIFPDP